MSSSYLAISLLCLVPAALVLAEPEGRIVGGESAALAQFPFQVSLRYLDGHICGGSIISNRYILTAAHCVVTTQSDGGMTNRPPENLTVHAGSIDRHRGGIAIRVNSIIVHPNYRFNMNDIALLKLAKFLPFSRTIQPIPLTTIEKPVGSKVVISGWGRLKTGGSRPDMLQWTSVKVISDVECQKRVQISSERLMCVDHPESVGPCNGDSGGPAVYNGHLVGVANMIIKGCGTIRPDIYANVYYFLPWIKEHSDV